jgi:hypothetical protein
MEASDMANPKPASDVIARWSTLFDDFNTSAKDFYVSVEEEVRRREVPDTTTARIDYHEGGVFSAQREYLRIGRGTLVFDVCAAPFGKGYFISSWFAETRSPWGPLALLILAILFFVGSSTAFQVSVLWGILFLLLGPPAGLWFFANFMAAQQEGWDNALVAMPLLGRLYEKFFRPETYYRQDSRLMYQETIHRAVMAVVDQLSAAKGLRVLTEAERKPIMKDFLK